MGRLSGATNLRPGLVQRLHPNGVAVTFSPVISRVDLARIGIAYESTELSQVDARF